MEELNQEIDKISSEENDKGGKVEE
jgi:hypothetical protein